MGYNGRCLVKIEEPCLCFLGVECSCAVYCAVYNLYEVEGKLRWVSVYVRVCTCGSFRCIGFLLGDPLENM